MEKKQEYWETMPAWYFFLAATAAMMLVIAVASDLLEARTAGEINGWVSLISVVLAGAGSLLLLAELTHKSRGYLVNSRPFSSVMSFGSLVQSLFIGLAFIYGTFFFGFIPWRDIGWLKNIVAVLTIIVALLYVAYPGIELGEAKGRGFWNGGGLVGVFLVNGAVTGAAALLLILASTGYAGDFYATVIRILAVGCLIAQLLAIPGYVMGMKLSSAEEARRGAQLLWSGAFSRPFWGGVVVIGTLVPLLLCLLTSSGLGIVIAAVLALAGGIMFRLNFLRAAVRVTLPGEERPELNKKELARLASFLEARWQEKARWLSPK